MRLLNAVRWKKQNYALKMIGAWFFYLFADYELCLHASMPSVGKSASAICSPAFSAEKFWNLILFNHNEAGIFDLLFLILKG